MRHIKIVADSACDIFELAGVELSVAPLKILTDEREFKDTPDLNVADMVEYFDPYKGKSKSSCPNTGDWPDAFGDAEEIFCMTITGGLCSFYAEKGGILIGFEKVSCQNAYKSF